MYMCIIIHEYRSVECVKEKYNIAAVIYLLIMTSILVYFQNHLLSNIAH